MSEHVEGLTNARMQLVNQRRLLATALSEPPSDRQKTMTNLEKFLLIQNAIESIDRAIIDESKNLPFP